MFEPRVCEITKVTWDGESNVRFDTTDGTWQGAKRKDFWGPDENWEGILKVGTQLRLWTIQWCKVLGFEYWNEAEARWIAVWCMANDFKPKAERDASHKAYCDFIEAEGKRIAQWIDEGCTLEDIDAKISKDHTGNTYGMALAMGIQTAKNRDLADIIRKFHNEKYGVKDGDGIVNPAVLKIKI